MNFDRATKIIEKVFPIYEELLGLEDWAIKIDCQRLDDAVGDVYVHADYKRARIRLDIEEFDTDEKMVQTLRHELLHVFLWTFDAWGVYAKAKLGERWGQEDDAMHTFFSERQVGALEALLDGMGLPDLGLDMPELLEYN